MIQIRNPDPDFLPIPDPGSRGQKGTGSRMRIIKNGHASAAKALPKFLFKFYGPVHGTIAFLDPEPKLNPNPDPKTSGKSSFVDESGSGRAKNSHENRRKIRNFIF
jgi:hypothetical protein